MYKNTLLKSMLLCTRDKMVQCALLHISSSLEWKTAYFTPEGNSIESGVFFQKKTKLILACGPLDIAYCLKTLL